MTKLTSLNRQTLPADRVLGASAGTRTGIVHLGLGNFHRAHAAVYTAKAMQVEPGDWGIVGVANRSHGVVDQMAAQDYLYSLLELSSAGEQVDIMDVHRRTLVATEQIPELIEVLADPAHKIVTQTLTEAGYRTNAATGELDVAAPDIAADIANPTDPKTMIGIVCAGLRRRFETGGAPLTVLSCDNMLSAGNTTHARVTQFLTAAQAPQELMDWLATSVTFPNAMVDRIVPTTTDKVRADVARILGLDDAVPVPCEDFTMWVLEDKFAAGRPAWEKVGAIFSDEVQKYELIKLRILNGCYSLIAYLGILAGEDTNPGAIAHDYIAGCVHAAQLNEYLPTIPLPGGFDVQHYMDELFDRWGNTTLNDNTWRVGTDGSTKLPQRIPEPAILALERGYVPQQMALTAAAWICTVCPPAGFNPGPIAAKVIEPQAERLARAAGNTTDVRQHTLNILHGGFLPDALVARDEFNQRVADFVEIIARDGIETACREALAAGTPIA